MVHGRDGQASHAVVVARHTDNARVWSKATEPAVLETFEIAETIGLTGHIRDGQFSF